jgi:hypothetical protein
LDHFIKRELSCPAFLRFVDDFLLFADSKSQLGQWREAIVNRLAQLRLTIHPAAQAKPVKEGIPFLGFIVFSEQRRLKRRKGVYYGRRFRQLVAAYQAGYISLERLTASVQGWTNHARYGNTVGLRRAVLTSQIVGAPRRKEDYNGFQ